MSDLLLNSGLLELLGSGLVSLLGVLAVQGVRMLQAKIKREYLRNVLQRLQITAMDAVKETWQTYVSALAEGKANDGKLSQSEREEAKRRAIATIKAHLGAKGIRELLKVLGLDEAALDKLLGTQVESAVYDAKLAGKAVAASAATRP